MRNQVTKKFANEFAVMTYSAHTSERVKDVNEVFKEFIEIVYITSPSFIQDSEVGGRG